MAARVNYLSADSRMQNPVEGDWQKLVRLGRDLKGAPRCVLGYAWQSRCKAPIGYGDSDWAGDRKTGKSTSGGIIMLRSHLIKSWSRTQDSATLAETELVALSKLAMEMLGVRSMASEWR